MKPPLELALLGPFEARLDGEQLELGGARPRALLAYLTLRPGEVVSSDRIVDDLWGEEAPASARRMVAVYVSRLRKVLGEGVIVTRRPGYSLAVEPAQIDAVRFERLLADGREAAAGGDPDAAGSRFGEALELWRGPALADFAYEPFAQTDIARLEELRLQAEEEKVGAELALGRGAELVAELETLVAVAPLRERRRGQLMLALFAAGRQADALAAYQDARRFYLDELGIEPGPELRHIERRVLAQDEQALALAPVAVRPSADSRRAVTLVAADLALEGASDDPEAVRLLARAALERAQQVVERHGGSIEELPGGPALAAFGSVVAHEDDAARALSAASELRARGVVSRAGLETGEIVISPGAPVSGPVVRAAVRLSDRAEAGDILVSVGVERLVREVAVLEPTGVGYRLLRFDADAPLRRLRLDAPLVGREDSLAALHQALEMAVGQSSARLVTVVGEPGIGKSRLAREFAARASNARILAGRCAAYGEGLTYRPLREILRSALGPEGPEGVLDLLAGEAAADEIAGGILSVLRSDDDLSVDDVRWAAQRLLRRLARRQPLLVVVEDAHWAEPTFLDLLSHAVAASSDAPLLVLCLARPEFLDERPDWPGERVGLETLSAAASAELLALLVPRLADDEEILTAASGNPLFLEQLAAFAAEGRRRRADGPIPPTLRSLLAARLDGLGPGERAVLERAAVFGQDFWAGGVADLLPAEGRASLRRHLEALAAKDLVEEGAAAGPFERGYRFRHVLIQEACYRTLPKRQRADFHELVARWLEANASADRDQVVGYHLERAYAYRSELGQVDDETRELGRRAGERLDAAGERALDWGDAFAAVNLLERARAALAGHAGRLAVSVRLGEAYEAVGELKRAYALHAATREEARAAGDMRSEWLAAIKHAHVGRQVTPRAWGRVRIERIAAQALEAFEHLGDDRCLTRAWLFAAANAFTDCRYDEAAGLYRRALEHGERSGEQREALVAHERLHAALYYGSAHVDVARAEAEAVLARAEGRPGLAARVFLSVAGLLAMSSEGDESRRLYVRAKSIMEEMGLRFTLASAPLWAEEVGLMFGDAGFAEREMRAGYEQLEAMGEDGTRSTMAMLLAEALYQLGRCEEAEAFVDTGLALTSTDDMATVVRGRAVKAKLLARRGELQEAARLARAAAESAAETDDLVMRGQALISAAEVYSLAGQEQAAKDALSEAAAVSDRKGNVMTARQARARLGELLASTTPSR